MNVRRVGVSIITLGGGRRQPGDTVDHRVGYTEIAGIGEPVSVDCPLALVHAASEDDAETSCCGAARLL